MSAKIKQQKNDEDLTDLKSKLAVALIKNKIALRKKKEVAEKLKLVLDRHNTKCEEYCNGCETIPV